MNINCEENRHKVHGLMSLLFTDCVCVCVCVQALLKLDCQGLVVRLMLDFVLLTTAVEVAPRWRELAEKLARVSKQQMDDYEAPHRDRNGVMDSEVNKHINTVYIHCAVASVFSLPVNKA